MKEAESRLQRKLAEEKLREHKKYIERILDNMPIGLAVNTIDDGAGGTAVVLHLDHRLSVDLDFFTPHDLMETPVSDDSLPTPLASLRDLALMKLIAVNQRGACKDFIDLKYIMGNTGLTFEVLLQDFGRKYAVGEEIFFQRNDRI